MRQSEEMIAHAQEIAVRHLTYKNAYIDDRCENYDKAFNLHSNFELIEVTREELDQRRHKEYMMGANL